MALNFPNPSRTTTHLDTVHVSGATTKRAIAFLVDDALPEHRDGFRRTRCTGGLYVAVPMLTSATPECRTN